MKARKIYEKLLQGSKNIRFDELCTVVESFGYRLDRTRGSHHIFEHPEATRPLNLQDDHGKAKPYQVRQFLRDVEEFRLTIKG